MAGIDYEWKYNPQLGDFEKVQVDRTPTQAGDAIVVASTTDLAKLLRVHLDVPQQTYSGTIFQAAVEVRLADEYVDKPIELTDGLLGIMPRSNPWQGFIDFILERNGNTYVQCSRNFAYFPQGQIFFDEDVYRYERDIMAPYPPRPNEVLAVKSRIRVGENYVNSPWEAPWIDTAQIQLVRRPE